MKKMLKKLERTVGYYANPKISGLDYCVIGFPKCGTTTLYDLLWDHSSCRLPYIKETHFLSRFGVEYQELNHELFPTGNGPRLPKLRDFRKQFRKGRASTVEITPSYIFKIDRVMTNYSNIFSNNPKLVVFLRDPISAATSHYRMMLRNQVHNIPPENLENIDAELWKSGSYRIASFSCYNYEQILTTRDFSNCVFIKTEKFLANLDYTNQVCQMFDRECKNIEYVPKSNTFSKSKGLSNLQIEYVERFREIATKKLDVAKRNYEAINFE